MGQIGIVTTDRRPDDIDLYATALTNIGATYQFLSDDTVLAKQLSSDTTGLLVTDGPELSDQSDSREDLLAMAEMELIKQALARDLPVLCVGRGFHLLNILEGGSQPVSIQPTHFESRENESPEHQHQIFLSPGAKTSATMGTTGFFKVNSYHHYGIYDKQKSNRLMAMAYSVDDGMIEILESPNHSWVIATQFNLEKLQELPRLFLNLFLALMERSEFTPEI